MFFRSKSVSPVSAIKYNIEIYDGISDFVHNEKRNITEYYIPSLKLCFNKEAAFIADEARNKIRKSRLDAMPVKERYAIQMREDFDYSEYEFIEELASTPVKITESIVAKLLEISDLEKKLMEEKATLKTIYHKVANNSVHTNDMSSTLDAVKYNVEVCESLCAAIHNEMRNIEEYYIPILKLCFNSEAAFIAEQPRNGIENSIPVKIPVTLTSELKRIADLENELIQKKADLQANSDYDKLFSKSFDLKNKNCCIM